MGLGVVAEVRAWADMRVGSGAGVWRSAGLACGHLCLIQSFNLIWSGLALSRLAMPGLVRAGLVQSGLVWLMLVWSGLVWSGLVWPRLVGRGVGVGARHGVGAGCSV